MFPTNPHAGLSVPKDTGTWWETMSHQKNAYDYNAVWESFLNANPSKSEIIKFGRDLMKQYGFSVNF